MLNNEYMTIAEASKKWGLSQRQVQHLCTLGSVDGAVKFGRAWMIPMNAKKPVDGRTKQARSKYDANMPLPRKTPFLYMTDLYHTPGTADKVGESLAYNHEAQVLFEAEVAYSRGEIDKVYDIANYLLHKHSGFYAVLSAGMLLAMCAVWKGDINMWRKAKVHIAEAPAKNDDDRDVMQLAISAVDIMIYNVESFPEWFKKGRFEPIHKDAYPAAKVYYAKYLYALGYAVAMGLVKVDGTQGLYIMSVISFSVEPMISWARANNTIMAEIYLRLTCAAIYHNCGNDEDAIYHIDKAIKLALPDKFYGVLAEYCRALDTLMERQLSLIDEDAWKEVKKLYKIYNEGWSKLSGAVRGKKILTTLSDKEREVAKLAAFGMGNQEIADHLHLSLSVVKQAVRIVSEKSGLPRSEFAAIL
ncbi:MAG: helix-turn-helix transcriptional regulator [Ruminococcaceae bacterium]|nr:helix-turn-helix transcriptional regulator [Oscillospiraceae bacterium]